MVYACKINEVVLDVRVDGDGNGDVCVHAWIHVRLGIV